MIRSEASPSPERRVGCGALPVCALAAVGVAGLIVSVSPAARGGEARPQDTMTAVREAFVAALDGLKSGKGKGGYRHYRGDGSLRDDVRFEVQFHRERFHLQLTHLQRPPSFPPADRQIAISDGSGIFVTSFSERIRPHGSETRAYDAGKLTRALPDFRYDLTRLPREMMRLEYLEEHATEFEELPNGRYRCKFNLTEQYEVTLEFAPEYGYNVAMREGRNKLGQITSRYTATWRQAKGLWYIERFVREAWRDGNLRGKTELWYDEFEVNPAVSADLFKLDSRGMAEGTRMVDERSGSPATSQNRDKR